MQTGATKFPLAYLSFNQDGTCVAVGTRRGFRVYTASPFKFLYAHEFADGCAVVAMLFRSSILAVCGAGANARYPREAVVLYDDQSGRNLGEVPLTGPACCVALSRERMFAVCETEVAVFSIADLKRVDTIKTSQNPTGLLAMAGERDVTVATVGLKLGEVQVRKYAGDQITAQAAVSCHESAVGCLALSSDGALLATASTKGTLVRIFDVAQKRLVKELRRGTQESAISSIAFSPDSRRLACSSDHGTVHVFSVGEETEGVENKKSSLKFLGGVAKYFDSEWSFAKHSLNCPVSLLRFSSPDLLMAICADGNYYKLRIEGEKIHVEETQSLLQE